MTDWQDALNLMEDTGKNNKIQKNKKNKRNKNNNKLQVGLRCWDCGRYIDKLVGGHYCTRCLIIKLKKFSGLSFQEPNDENPQSSEQDQDENDANEDSDDN